VNTIKAWVVELFPTATTMLVLAAEIPLRLPTETPLDWETQDVPPFVVFKITL
jgi:hypothetical protein